jgi:type IV secretory pathway TrbF-like protein
MKNLNPFNKSKKNLNSGQNPFVAGSEGREEWNDRYFNMKKAIRNWQIAFLITSLSVIILSLLLVKITTQSQIKPYVVETCNGNPQAILPVTGNVPQEDKLVNYAISQFIVNARSIVSDGDAEKMALDKVYAFSADRTIEFLRNYFNKNNPFLLATQKTIQAIIVNSMKISPHTWQITWEETEKRTNDEESNKKTRWAAMITYRMGTPNEKFINQNPFGIYFTEISWSKIQEQNR